MIQQFHSSVYIWKKMKTLIQIDVHRTYHGNHLMMHPSQIIILYILNLYSAVYKLYLNKAGKNKLIKEC